MRRPALAALSIFLLASGGTLSFAGCGGSTAESNDNASCIVSSSTYDQTCEVDSDCVLVPPGGNTCNGCNNPTGCFACDMAAVNVKASATYLAALKVALQRYQNDPLSCTSGCPEGEPAHCENGTCTTSFGNICQVAP